MRAYAGNGTASREKLTLANGIPVTIALEFASGKRVSSRIPGAPDQIYYTLTDGRGFYADLAASEMIEQLNLRQREPFTICKWGQNDWEVTRATSPTVTPAPETPRTRLGGERAPENREPSGNGRSAAGYVPPDHIPERTPPPEPATKLEYALKTAILAASNAEKYATEIGYTVRFDADAIRAMAITVLINMEGARK